MIVWNSPFQPPPSPPKPSIWSKTPRMKTPQEFLKGAFTLGKYTLGICWSTFNATLDLSQGKFCYICDIHRNPVQYLLKSKPSSAKWNTFFCVKVAWDSPFFPGRQSSPQLVLKSCDWVPFQAAVLNITDSGVEFIQINGISIGVKICLPTSSLFNQSTV